MNLRILSISVSTARPLPHAFIQMELAKLDDWIKFSDSQYFVLTRRPTSEVSNMVRANMFPDDFIMVSEINMSDIYGWAPGLLLQWIGNARSAIAQDRLVPLPPPV
jgi:hypothetical protein